MIDNTLTDYEIDLLEQLPGPPEIAEFRTTNVWIIEWLSPSEQKTGKILHEWLKEHRPGWSAYSPCKNKADVFEVIERITNRAQNFKMIPVLHIEAHGDENGIYPDRRGTELINWDELTDPLQMLNLATCCSLVVFVAACTGFAAIRTFRRGPRAPALALVGPDNNLKGSDLLWGTKEFYRRWINGCPKLDDIAKSASREIEPAVFELEPFALLAYESMVQFLIKSLRTSKQQRSRLPSVSKKLQSKWDKLFMIDLHPGNNERFGIDVAAIVEMILHHHKRGLLLSKSI